MEKILFFYATSMILLILINGIEFSRDKDTLSARRKQTEGMFRENVLREKLDKTLEEKVKLSKRNAMEDKMKQAGYDASFTDFVIISIFSGILMAVIFGTLMTNPFLAVLFLVFGTLVPYQFISFVRNRRVELLDKQVGAFMQMVIKRYENTRNMHTALKMTAKEFHGEEPISSEINKTVLEIDLGVPTAKALDNMAVRTGNKYMERFVSYYKVASEVGTDDLRRDLLMQAYIQYEENRQLKRALDEKISGPVKDAKIMIFSVPMFAIYQLITNDDYATFMTKTTTGKIGTAGIIGTLILIIWFVNAKIGAPIDEEKKK